MAVIIVNINGNIYPYNLEARKFPIYLTGIGGTDWQGAISRPMGYQWHQIILSESGEGVLKYDNTVTELKPGDCFFLPANYPHEYHPAVEKWRTDYIAFDGYSTAHILSLLEMTKPAVISTTDFEVFTKLFKQMYSYITQDKYYGNMMCTGLTYQFVLEFYRRMNLKINKSKIERSGMLANVINYINAHYKEDFPLTVLSELSGMSHQNFSRIFKDATNSRPKEYITQLRIGEAKRLLRETGKNIADIAGEVGFSDSAYFCAVFKKLENISPLEYRKSFQTFKS